MPIHMDFTRDLDINGFTQKMPNLVLKTALNIWPDRFVLDRTMIYLKSCASNRSDYKQWNWVHFSIVLTCVEP